MSEILHVPRPPPPLCIHLVIEHVSVTRRWARPWDTKVVLAFRELVVKWEDGSQNN